jgi:ethanolamine ammonia-lyase large subunit
VNDLRRLFTLANAFKEGDLLVGGTRDDVVREAARRELLHTRVGDIRRTAFIEDQVSEALETTRDRRHDAALDPLTIGELKQTVLGRQGTAWVCAHQQALGSEVIAALGKVMTSEELASLARRLFNPLPNGVGADGHFGSRIQPNSPGDDEEEILFSTLDGLSHGCGDVILGLNPAADEIDTIVRLEELLERVVDRLTLPTRYCVLSDIVKQQAARVRTRVDVGFQSLAGTSKALVGMVGLDVSGILDLARGFDGLYFETGQGSAVTNGTAEGVDMVTLESRAYGVARHIQRQTGCSWMIVNDVAGFIGPEVFRTSAQLERACLEDLVMAKLHGITMGLDVCSTFHMGIAPADLRAVTTRVVQHGSPAYLMGVAGNADPMLGYLTTSFREHPALRQATGRHLTAQMERRLSEFTVATGDGPAIKVAHLYAVYAKAGGDTRAVDTLVEEGRRKVAGLQERGFDISQDEASSLLRVERIYEHARRALYSVVDESVIRDACPVHVRVRTRAANRDDYIAHPASGERVHQDDVAAVMRLASDRRPAIQMVVSDGLNADAINEQLRALCGALRRLLANAGQGGVAEAVVVVHNGRVRAGYHIAQLLNPEVLVHIVGERPGTGINTASAYLTYGRDEDGRSRWDPQLDHSCTTAVCGIHPAGKPPETAASEIARTVRRMFEQRRSGVALR